jgi:hypothetical protein
MVATLFCSSKLSSLLWEKYMEHFSIFIKFGESCFVFSMEDVATCLRIRNEILFAPKILNPSTQLESMHPHSMVGDVDAFPPSKTHPLSANNNQCPLMPHNILFLDMRKIDLFALDSNTTDGKKIMQYLSPNGPNIGTNVGSLHHPHLICIVSSKTWNPINQHYFQQ